MTFPPDPPNPWTTRSTDVQHDSPWIRLDHHYVVRPDGSEGRYGVVHFKNRAVGVVPYEKGGIWLVGQTRFALGRYSWEIPEGGVPEAEDMLEAAKRELHEEAGISAERWRHLFDLHTSNSVTDEWGQVFLATELTHGEAEPEPVEDISQLFVPMSDALKAIETGRITDGITIAALYRVELMRRDGLLLD